MSEDKQAWYKRNQTVLPGLAKAAWFRERVYLAVMSAALFFAAWMAVRGNSQLAACKAEKGAGWIVVLDPNGGRVDVPAISADEYRMANGMVRGILTDAVTCIHGLDSDLGVYKKCRDKYSPLFVGDAAVKLASFDKQRFPTPNAVKAAQRAETVEVVVQGYDIPANNADAQGRYWLRWKTVHHPRMGGKDTEEFWSSTFDVELIPLDKDPKSAGLQIVDWNQHQEKEAG
jgi:hypothetical protein